MLKDLVTPALRLAAHQSEPVAERRPRLCGPSILDPKFEYSPAECGSAILNEWKRKRIRSGKWRGQEST